MHAHAPRNKSNKKPPQILFVSTYKTLLKGIIEDVNVYNLINHKIQWHNNVNILKINIQHNLKTKPQ